MRHLFNLSLTLLVLLALSACGSSTQTPGTDDPTLHDQLH
jgi:hypothetical protein